MSRLLLLAVLPLATAFVLQPVLKPQMRAAPVAKMAIADIKDAVLPTDTDETLRNFVGYQALGWGVTGLVFPYQMMTSLFGSTLTAPAATLLRGMSIANLCLGSKICAGQDYEAATTGFVFFAGWTYLIKEGIKAGILSGYSSQILLWNAICALVCARRNGGLFDTVTKLDVGTLSSLLPRDRETSTRNLVGVQLFAWGIIGAFYQSFLLGPNMLGVAGGALMSLQASGLGLANLLLGGRVLGGDDKAAAPIGAVIFGSWAVLGWLGKAAGIFTGKYILATTIWNAVFAAYCFKESM